MKRKLLLVVLFTLLVTVLCEDMIADRKRLKLLTKHQDKTSKGKYAPGEDDRIKEDFITQLDQARNSQIEHSKDFNPEGYSTYRNNNPSSTSGSSGKNVQSTSPSNLPKTSLKSSEEVREKGRRNKNTMLGEGICQTMDIRNNLTNFESLRNCVVIEGFLQIVLIHNNTELDYQNFSFPALREITGYLLLYRVYGMKSLGSLFPNLEVIRGNILFTDYAFMVYEMPSLQEIGLKKLTKISRGSVRIEKNPHLCYTKTVNWNKIVVAGENFIKENQEKNCPGCSQCPGGHCWTAKHCQQIEKPPCHKECLGECSGPLDSDCYVCEHFRHEGRCVESCPPHLYSYLLRRCITKAECKDINNKITRLKSNDFEEERISWRPFNGSCINQCPDGYEDSYEEGHEDGPDEYKECRLCKGRCSKFGIGGIIRHISDVQRFRGTTLVKGALEFQIRNGNPNIMNELSDSFGLIEEITGYLKVTHSSSITTLGFLRKLRVIRGEKLEYNNASLIVMDNPNLSSLFSSDQPVQILNGRLFFHYNPKLCISKILDMSKIAGITNITDLEVHPESNGEKVACNTVNINITVSDKGSYYANLVWDSYKPSNDQRLLSYLLSYIETENKNITYDSDSCGNNNWEIVDVDVPDDNTSTTVSNLVTDLKPFTQYAVYVKTFTSRSKNNFDPVGLSNIIFFRTKSDIPTVPMNVNSFPTSDKEIVVEWDPPEMPNGPIGYYIVSGFIRPDDQEALSTRDYCKYGLLPEVEIEIPQEVTVRTPSIDHQSCCKDSDAEVVTSKKFEILCHENMTIGHTSPGRKDYCIPKRYSSTNALDNSTDFDDGLASKIPLKDHNVSKIIHDTKTQIYNGIYYSFVFNVSANTSSWILKDLKHYSMYTISVAACGRKVENDVQMCSPVQYTTTRTNKSANADDVHNVNVKVFNNSIAIVSWDPVRDPNSLIVAYNVEYTNLDVKDAKKSTECLTEKKFRVKRGEYHIKNLSPGTYSLRVRSISLAGDGNFSKTVKFAIGLKGSNTMLVALMVTLGFVCGILLAVFFFYNKHKRKKTQERLIASVNPDYIETKYVVDHWEVNREDVEVLEELGLGNFGMVYRGRLNTGVKVAIKTIADTASEREKNEFLNEASVMKNFSTTHIIKLLGVVSVGSPPFVIMELMENGDLKTYLRRIRDTDMVPDTTRILRMAAEIADGMAYLESKKFVHRDLAARNCMISKNLVCKIGDFGMARDIYETDYYKIGKKGLLPIRWMAPENLSDGVFTSDSDVWSYGVVLYEILTLAEIPYQGFSNEEVLNYVLRKGTLTIPRNCPELIHKMMERCFKWRPSDRPTFMEIVAELEPFLGQDFCDSSFYHSEAGVEIRTLGIKKVYHHAAPIRFHWGNETARWIREFEDNVTLLDQTKAGTSRGRIFKNGFQHFSTVPNMEDVPLDR
ncbi:insulin-like peptide receptor [Cephus cinctus]|uniref:receptor protein-tyrosine kinase n=1 Tax=Cephus cinctus TaxID=211228 RepID=A0AAJ7RGQ4_CEPCN|nr:insulin-like peptide receptor [Cephus cinctus]XP_024940156.1 insulin-like peptide receptor [Cephus cinctus]